MCSLRPEQLFVYSGSRKVFRLFTSRLFECEGCGYMRDVNGPWCWECYPKWLEDAECWSRTRALGHGRITVLLVI